jgi:hypothetical protein
MAIYRLLLTRNGERIAADTRKRSDAAHHRACMIVARHAGDMGEGGETLKEWLDKVDAIDFDKGGTASIGDATLFVTRSIS